MHRVRTLSIFAALAALLVLAACPQREVAEVGPRPTQQEFKDIPVDINRNVDILFVIDNSGSMAEEQASLTANFHRFINVLEGIDGGLPSVHIGVISSDLGAGPYVGSGCAGTGDSGALQSTPRVAGCSPPTGAFIRDIAREDGSRDTNYSGTLADTFACIAHLGINGCGFEQHLESMRRALNGSHPTSTGFLRKNAYLAVVFIADEDDCSTEDLRMFDQNDLSLGRLHSYRCTEYGIVCDPDTPRNPGSYENCRPRDDSPYMYMVDEYVDFLEGLKDHPGMVIVAGIIGNPTPVVVELDSQGRPQLRPSCSTEGAGSADPGVRFKYLIDRFAPRSTISTICNEDLSDALLLIAKLMAKEIENPACLESDIDLDPDIPGVQYECVVSEVRFPGEDRQEETILPECDDARTRLPCWHLEEDLVGCADTPTNMNLVVERGGHTVPPGSRIHLRCASR
jgi:hypothetical protein